LGELEGFSEVRGRWIYRGGYPHAKLSVRGTGGRRIRLRDSAGRRLGEADFETALRELHPGAVYLHQGDNYLVRNLELERGEAFLLPHLEDTYTQVRQQTDITVLEETARFGRVRVGRVRVRNDYPSYVLKRLYSEKVLDERALELPEVSYSTQALWFDTFEVAGSVPPSLLPSGLHALEHTLIGLLPAFVLCERTDVGGVSYPLYPETGTPMIFIYDGYPGGVGYARAGAARFAAWLGAARELLASCACQSGCPRCILSPKCGNGNQFLDKRAALQLAEALLALGD
jgi:DEAD/DEAH box helicase domain-containing protein